MAEKKRRPPYTSGSDVQTLFESIRNKQAPKKLDTEWVKSYKIAQQTEAIPSLLEWLGIVDDAGAVDVETWNRVRIPQSREAALAPLVRSGYAEIFERIDVESASQEDLASTFVLAYSMGDPSRQVRCFVALCELAGISVGADVKKERSEHPSTPEKTTGAKTTAQTKAGKETPRTNPVVSSAGIFVSLSVEIPAAWDEGQIRDRVVTVARVLSEVGLGAN